ncbi:MAG: hypothetical protein M0D55_14355 [Elusimicrobiota bacterium]|nr:MAG: hypothetical protein M0D55_14355 [Elusimicrobiota bacterium]
MRKRLAALLTLALLTPSNALAAFEDVGFGPRDVAMGGAFCAVGDDPGVVAYNPASLGQATAVDTAAAYLRQFHSPSGESDRDVTRAAVVAPVRQEIFNGAFSFDARYDRRTRVGGDRSFGVAYGTRGLKETEGGGVDFGGALRLLSTAFDSGGGSGSKLALDLGVLYRFKDRYSLGASLLNFGSPKFGPDRAPLTLKVGAAEQLRGVIFAADFTKRENSSAGNGQHTMAVGFERWWATARAGQFALRSGLSLGEGSRTWNWGLGWRAQGARLDYSMTVPMTGVARFGHGLSLSVRFGRADPEGEYEKLLTQELKYRRQLNEALEASSIKQWKLAEELNRLRAEMTSLRAEVENKRASESEARRRLQDLEDRQKRAAESFEKAKLDRASMALKTKQWLFQEDWRSYQKAKLAGAADSVLLEQVGRLLREYRDSGVDLSEASQELRRLQRAK